MYDRIYHIIKITVFSCLHFYQTLGTSMYTTHLLAKKKYPSWENTYSGGTTLLVPVEQIKHVKHLTGNNYQQVSTGTRLPADFIYECA